MPRYEIEKIKKRIKSDATYYNFSVLEFVHIREFEATIFHLLGFDHETFSYNLQCLDFKLVGVEKTSEIKGLLS